MALAARFDVISDIQGELDDLRDALEYFTEAGVGDALLVVGDLTPNGHAVEYEALFARLNAVPHAPALYAAGNHDFYNDESNAVSINRFLEFTGMPAMYASHDVAGVRVIRLGTLDGSEKSGHCVVLGDEQLEWLAGELDAAPPDAPVIVISHHALPRTVSGSYDDPKTQAPKLYQADYAESDRLLGILGGHPNVLFLSGHTHWSLYRSDWFARRVVLGGHPSGFAAANTGAVQKGFGSDGNGGEIPLDPADNQGLRIEVDGRTVRIHAVDFRRRREIHCVEYEI